jgi:hypothetical protein
MNELQRTAHLIERLLGDPALRRRFRADPTAVLVQAGLPQLASGLGERDRAFMTLEMRESRSSLAGVLVAAAAEGVSFVELADHAAPALAHQADQAVDQMLSKPRVALRHVEHAAAPAPAPSLGEPVTPPRLAAKPVPAAPPPSPRPEPVSTTPVAAPSVVPHEHAAAHHQHEVGGLQCGPHGQIAELLPAYPGDQAPPAQLASWMGAYAKRAGLPPELPVMAALTESGLRNLNYGDRDSVGFFQMRLGIWDEGPYAGYPDHPELQIRWFIDHAVAVRDENPALAQSPDSWGEWVADVEQPAAQYRYRYQLQLQAAQALLSGADLSPVAGGVAPVSAGHAAVDAVLGLAGQSGSSLHSTIDPGQLVQYAYAHQDVRLPPAAAEQFDIGKPIARADLRPGDAVFFARRDGLIDRVGLYVGHGKLVTASPEGGHVRVTTLHDPDFDARFVGARRYSAQTLGDPRSYARPLPTVKK